MKSIKLNDNVIFSNDNKFVLIAGPCALENRDHAMMMAENIVKITNELNIPYVFKTSFDKANRTSLCSARGCGLEYAKEVFDEIKETFDCPIITDIHLPEQAEEVAKYVDILQIPAFLARQTDLLVAASKTDKIINIKKPQFAAPRDMKALIGKVRDTGNDKVMLTERGSSFGYNNLVVDMRAIPWMKENDVPVIIDATHAIQQPSVDGIKSGGDRRLAPVIARAAVAVGVAGVFMEVHDNPDVAPCDGPNMIKLSNLKELLKILVDIDNIAKVNPIIID